MWVASFPGLVVRSENEVCTMSWDVLIASFPGLVVRSENEVCTMSWDVLIASFPGLQSPYAVEGLVKLIRRMTSVRRWR